MIAAESQGFSKDDASIQRLCGLGGVSRAGYYRRLAPQRSAREDADLRDLIQRVALADRHYGYRRVTHELRRQGLIVNAKRVARLMRNDNLLALRAKPFVPRTTMSNHDCPIRPNLVRKLKPTGLDQSGSPTSPSSGSPKTSSISRSSSTPSRAKWSAGRSKTISKRVLAAAALDMALNRRNPPPDSLIHHSDRGVRYACGDYLERLQRRKIAISMSRPANPYDNAKAESFMKTLKAEEVNGNAYANLDDARRQIGAFIDTVYNARRLHSALGYKPPAEFEADLGRAANRQPQQNGALSLN